MQLQVLYTVVASLLISLLAPVYARTAGGYDCSGFLGTASNYAPGDAVRAIEVFRGFI